MVAMADMVLEADGDFAHWQSDRAKSGQHLSNYTALAQFRRQMAGREQAGRRRFRRSRRIDQKAQELTGRQCEAGGKHKQWRCAVFGGVEESSAKGGERRRRRGRKMIFFERVLVSSGEGRFAQVSGRRGE